MDTFSMALIAVLALLHQAEAFLRRTSQTSSSNDSYNILFLMCDSMDGRVLDPNSPVSTYLDMPYMWSLAAQGVNFANTYSNNPMCVPSRSSMFTGRHSHQIKVWRNEGGLAATPGSGIYSGQWELDPTCIKMYDEALCQHWAQEQNVSDTFVETLQAKGVDVMLFGKLDVGGNFVNRPEQKPYGPFLSAWRWKNLVSIGRAADIRKPTQDRPEANITDGLSHDWPTIDHCKKWLEDHPNAPGQWMLYCSIIWPHPPYQCNASQLKHVRNDISLPKWFVSPEIQPESNMHPYDAYMSFTKNMMDEQGNFSKELLQENMRCWYAMVYETDKMLGQVWATAGATGNLKNTIVIFTSDHGEMHMEKRQHLKNSMYEASVRVPLLIAGPGSTPGFRSRASFRAGKVVKDLTSLLDMYPTFADATGSTLPCHLPGRSLIPYLRGTSLPINDRSIVSMYGSAFGNTNTFMIRKGPWKYIAYGHFGPAWYQAYKPQLFNLEQDPSERRDVSLDNPDIVLTLDKELLLAVDYEAVDRELKMEERMLYDRFYANMGEKAARKKWESDYKGFDDEDARKVKQWYDQTPSENQP